MIGAKDEIEHALLLAILAHPEDPLNRLAYADWLEEQGKGLPFLREEGRWYFGHTKRLNYGKTLTKQFPIHRCDDMDATCVSCKRNVMGPNLHVWYVISLAKGWLCTPCMSPKQLSYEFC